MHVAVGSTNPVKLEAVEETLERFDPTVTAVAVDSGIPEQPGRLQRRSPEPKTALGGHSQRTQQTTALVSRVASRASRRLQGYT